MTTLMTTVIMLLGYGFLVLVVALTWGIMNLFK